MSINEKKELSTGLWKVSTDEEKNQRQVNSVHLHTMEQQTFISLVH